MAPEPHSDAGTGQATRGTCEGNLAATSAHVFRLAWPSIISEISTPLLGLVDTCVVGHLADPDDLAGVALAVAVLNPALFVFNFLRMGTGGVTAQAFGAKDAEELLACAARAVLCGLCIGLALWALQAPLAALGFSFARAPDASVRAAAGRYFSARVAGAPAALANFGLQAWLIGVQRPDRALAQNVVLNTANAVLCVLLGWRMGLGVAGVGAATAIANWLALAFGLAQARAAFRQLPWAPTGGQISLDWAVVLDRRRLAGLAALSGNIFLRSVCLMFITADFTALSAEIGKVALAANSLLMQFQMLISFGADGFANASEALVGEAVGAGETRRLRRVLAASLCWGGALGLGFAAAYTAGGRWLLRALTWHADVAEYAEAYLPWQWAAPLLSVTAYLMDGIFVGATRPREMRDATFLALVAFVVVGRLTRGSNQGLWAAYIVHLVVRAVALLSWYPRIERALGSGTSSLLHAPSSVANVESTA